VITRFFAWFKALDAGWCRQMTLENFVSEEAGGFSFFMPFCSVINWFHKCILGRLFRSRKARTTFLYTKTFKIKIILQNLRQKMKDLDTRLSRFLNRLIAKYRFLGEGMLLLKILMRWNKSPDKFSFGFLKLFFTQLWFWFRGGPLFCKDLL
jgi:hypothetical protein